MKENCGPLRVSFLLIQVFFYDFSSLNFYFLACDHFYISFNQLGTISLTLENAITMTLVAYFVVSQTF